MASSKSLQEAARAALEATLIDADDGDLAHKALAEVRGILRAALAAASEASPTREELAEALRGLVGAIKYDLPQGEYHYANARALLARLDGGV